MMFFSFLNGYKKYSEILLQTQTFIDFATASSYEEIVHFFKIKNYIQSG